MLTNKKTCELAVHFNCIEHDISEISFIVIEKFGINTCNSVKPIGVFRFSGIFSNLAISLRIRARGKKYLSDIELEYIVFAC